MSLSMAHMISRVSKKYCWGATDDLFSPQCVSCGPRDAKQPLWAPTALRLLPRGIWWIVLTRLFSFLSPELRVKSLDVNSSRPDAGLEHGNCTRVHRCPLWKSLIRQIIPGHTQGNNGRATNENWIPVKHCFPPIHPFIINNIFDIFVKNSVLDIYTTLMTDLKLENICTEGNMKKYIKYRLLRCRGLQTEEWNAVTAFFLNNKIPLSK